MYLKGFNSSKRSLKLQGKATREFIDASVEIVTREAVLEAKKNAEKDSGDLHQKIFGEVTKTKDKVTGRLSANSEHAVFREFGTGGKVDIPKGFEAMAKRAGDATKKGKWADFIEAIEDWCVRHGMPKEAAYPVAMNIYKNGVKPNPIIIPAAKRAYKDLIKRLKTRMKG